MTMLEQIKLIDEMIAEDLDYTIADFIELREQLEAIEESHHLQVH